MYFFLLRFFYLLFLTYFLLAAFISIRDVLTTTHKLLWLPIFTLLSGMVILVVNINWIPPISLMMVALISLPIFLTDKRRNWDRLDRIFRWVSIAAFFGAMLITYQYFAA